MYRLLINSEEAELNRDTKINVSRTIFDLSDLSKRGMKFTNAFVLPITAINDRLCGCPSRLSSNNQSFEKTYPYQLVDVNSIVSTGDLIVKDYDEKKGIKIQLVEAYNFWARAGEKRLNDLVNHEDDFQFTAANMNALKTKSSSVFVTALHTATGNKNDTALVDYTYTRPCYNFRVLLDKICEDLGYTVDYGTVLTNTVLEDVGCMSNAVDFFITDFKRRFEGVNLSGAINYSLSSVVIPATGNTTIGLNALTFNTYKTSVVIKGRVSSNFDTSIDVTFSDRTEKIAISKGIQFINFRSDVAEIGDSCIISCPDIVSLDDVYIYSAVREGDKFDIDGDIDIFNYWVLSDYNLPVITYKAFIKVLAKMFFLDCVVDEQNQILKLTYLGGAIDTNNFVDLTGRVNRNNKWSAGKVFGRLNVFTYQNDNDVDSDLGRAYFNIQNENAKPVKDFISVSEFSASNEVTVSGNTIMSAPIYNTSENKRQAVSNRIVFFNETGSFGINATFNQISFQRLYANHYFNLIENTKRERVLKFDVFLTNLLFNQLQTTPIIYDKDQESYFLVSSIGKFNRKQLAELEVVKYG